MPSAGMFEPPILITPRSSPQKFNSLRVVASIPSIIGNSPRAFGIPVIVTREVTERPEAVKVGSVVLVGTSRSKIVETTLSLLVEKRSISISNPYGDGKASLKIREIIKNVLFEKSNTYLKRFKIRDLWDVFFLIRIIDNPKKLKFLIGVLNSTLISFYINKVYNSLKMSGGYLNIGTEVIKAIPLPPKIDLDLFEEEIDILNDYEVENIFIENKKDLDIKIYKLYELSYDEVLVVEPEFSLSKQEYEAFTV
jgi:hypothetical protein